jgi:hypothetical protein
MVSRHHRDVIIIIMVIEITIIKISSARIMDRAGTKEDKDQQSNFALMDTMCKCAIYYVQKCVHKDSIEKIILKTRIQITRMKI